jgi:hypothetical protein
VFVLMLAGLSACNKSRCTELSRQAVEDDERTPAGSVEALMEAVSLDGEHPSVWWDGESTLATLRISRGLAGAVWVEQEERELEDGAIVYRSEMVLEFEEVME